MPTPDEIEALAQEIYELAKPSSVPLTVLCFESMNLLKQDGWKPADVERVSGLVIEMLIRHGWKPQTNQSGD